LQLSLFSTFKLKILFCILLKHLHKHCLYVVLNWNQWLEKGLVHLSSCFYFNVLLI
jgi:hypothetical protein